MGVNVVDQSTGKGQHVSATQSAQVMLYDQFGRSLANTDRTVVANPAGVLTGLDGNTILRIPRVGPFSSLRTTSESLLWHDAFEGSVINAFWTQSLTTMTAVQATGVLTLNNSNIATANTAAIITSQRQFQKYPRQPLYSRSRIQMSANPNAHTLAELGFGAPVGITPIVANGAFFRWTAAGTLVAVTSYNGAENVSAVLLAQGVLTVANYYNFDVILDDDYARFIVSDSSNTPIVDTTLKMPLSSPYSLAVSHIPTFARVYTDATGGGTTVQLRLAGHMVQILDSMMSLSWAEQAALTMRHASIDPTTYAQTGSTMTAAPATITPSNTLPGYTTLGGEFAIAMSTASENPLSVFTYQVPAPYTLMLTGLIFGAAYCSVAMTTTGAPTLEWIAIVNAASNNISTGGGQRYPTGVSFAYFASQAVGFVTLGNSNTAEIRRRAAPIACLPGTFIHIAYKVFTVSAVTAGGVTRGSLFVDGYFM